MKPDSTKTRQTTKYHAVIEVLSDRGVALDTSIVHGDPTGKDGKPHNAVLKYVNPSKQMNSVCVLFF